MASALRRLALLAAGAGAAYYARRRLLSQSEISAPAPSTPPGAEPPLAPAATAPAAPPGEVEEPPPLAFEDERQEGWYGEEVGAEPSAQDQLEDDPATVPEAERAAAAEGAGDEPQPALEPGVAGASGGHEAHVTRVVDDLLEGRRSEAPDEPIEDATLVEDERERGRDQP